METFAYALILALPLARVAYGWVTVSDNIERTFRMELLEVIDTVPIRELQKGDVILWKGNRNYHRTISDVSDSPVDTGLVIEFDDDLDDSWSVSPEQVHSLVELYAY